MQYRIARCHPQRCAVWTARKGIWMRCRSPARGHSKTNYQEYVVIAAVACAGRVLTQSACVHCSPRTGIFSSVLGGKGGRGERGHSCVSYGGPEARYRCPERWRDLQRRLSWRGCRSRLHSGGLERASHGGRNFEKASLEWCRGNSKVWENPVRENTTHYTVGYTCKVVLRSYLALGCEVT
jgi:hypothetical protein